MTTRIDREKRTDEFITDCLLDDYHTLSTGEPPRNPVDREYQRKVRKALKRVLHYYGVKVPE